MPSFLMDEIKEYVVSLYGIDSGSIKIVQSKDAMQT